MSRLLLIPLILLSLLAPGGLLAGTRADVGPRPPSCECCTTCCDWCTCCITDEDPIPARPQPARVVDGPRVHWAPAPEQPGPSAPVRDAGASFERPRVAVAASERVRLHARIGVWLN